LTEDTDVALCDIIGQGVCSQDGAVLGEVLDVVFTSAATSGRITEAAKPEEIAPHLVEGGLIAFALIDVGPFLGTSAHRVAMQVTEMEWNAGGEGITLPRPAACLRTQLPALEPR
jgi:hypothetical protein